MWGGRFLKKIIVCGQDDEVSFVPVLQMQLTATRGGMFLLYRIIGSGWEYRRQMTEQKI